MSWYFIVAIVFAVYSVLLGASAVVGRNVEEYRSSGYVDIGIKWLIANVWYFICQTLFPIVKYGLSLIILAIVIGIVLLVAGLGGDDVGDGNPFPEFMHDWWYAETQLFAGLEAMVLGIWKVISFCGIKIGGAISWLVKTFAIAPFTMIRKWLTNFKDISFFTIGKKPNDK